LTENKNAVHIKRLRRGERFAESVCRIESCDSTTVLSKSVGGPSPTVREYVMPKSTVFTDELPSYHGIPHMPEQGYVHRRINHSEKVQNVCSD
jgi:hypothetical protein